MPEKVLYRPAEAAALLSIGRTRLFELIATGELRSVKLGTSRLIPANAIEEFALQLQGARGE